MAWPCLNLKQMKPKPQGVSFWRYFTFVYYIYYGVVTCTCLRIRLALRKWTKEVNTEGQP